MAQRYFRVAKWDTFQHYSDRNPPWIKFYNSTLEDPKIGTLKDDQKAHLFGIWLLASRLGNRIPADAEFIAKRINATSKVNLQLFESIGLIEYLGQDASITLADGKQVAPQSRADQETDQDQEQRESAADAASKPLASGNGHAARMPPTLSDVEDFISEKALDVDPLKFFSYYDSIGWKVGRNPMKKWKMAVWNWSRGKQ